LNRLTFPQVVVLLVRRRLLVLGPLAAGHVDVEAIDGLVLPAPPAEVDPPEGRSRAVPDLHQVLAALGEDRSFVAEAAVLLGIPQGGDHLVTLALPLLFVGGNAASSPGGHLLDPVEVAEKQATFKLVAATHASFIILLLPEVAITTDG